MTSEPIGTEERYAVFPFYLCLDVSQSMAGEPVTQVNAELPELLSTIGQDPAVAEVVASAWSPSATWRGRCSR